MNKRLFITLLALLPLLAVQAQITVYDLYICGTQVTSQNASNILGDGAFSYNASTNVLTVQKDVSVENKNIIDNSIDGLTLNIARDVAFDSYGNQLMVYNRADCSMTVKGDGKLTMTNAEGTAGCFYIQGDATLTIDNMEIEAQGQNIFWGNKSSEKLVLRNSYIHAKCAGGGFGAIFELGGGITFEDCHISIPEDGYVDMARFMGIVNQDGSIAREVLIETGEAIKTYDLKVLGESVTSLNADDILGDGSFSYDPENNVLTISGDGSYNGTCVYSNIEGLTINVTQDVTLQASLTGLHIEEDATLTGAGKLTIKSESDCCIYAVGATITIDNMNIEVDGKWGIAGYPANEYLIVKGSNIHAISTDGAVCDFNSITLEDCIIIQPVGGAIDNGKVVDAEGNVATEVWIKTIEKYDLTICGTQVTSANAADILGDGAFSYDAETQTLTVSGDASTDEDIIWNKGIDGLTVNVVNDVTLEGVCIFEANTTLAGTGKLTLESEDNCPLFVQEATLTIEGMTIEVSGRWGITGVSEAEHLIVRNSTIHATGTNGAICDFTSITLDGCSITLPEGGYVDGGKIVDAEGNVAKEVWIKTVEEYDLTICGTQVTSDNAADILGDGAFSYDAETKTLTVSGDASTDEDIIWNKGIDGLTVNVVNDVTLEGVCIFEANTTLAGTGKLTLESEDNCPLFVQEATLTIEGMTIEVSGRWGITGVSEAEHLIVRNSTIHATGTNGAICDFTSITLDGCSITLPEGGYVDGGKIVDAEGNVAKEVWIKTVEEYDLTICGTQVTSNNAEDILGDRGFSYDAATKTLTVSRSVNIGFEAPIINNEGIDGLIINVTNDVTFKTEHLYVWPIRINANTTVTGKGKLTVKAKKEAGFIVRNHSTLTFDDVRVETEGEYGGVSGVETEYLVVRNAVLHAISTSTSNPAIRRFVSLTLDGVKITLPTNGQFRATGSVNSQMVVDADGNMAREVIIEPVPEEGQLMICHKLVTDDNASDVLEDGVFRFNASSKTLYINGDCTYDGTIIDSRLSGLTIVSEGVSSLRSLESEAIKGYNLTFKNSYPTKVVSDNDAAIRLLFKMPTIPVESMQTEIEGHLTIDGCEMEIEGKNYGLYSDVSWDMISDGVLQPQGYYNLYLYTYLTIVNSELIVRGNEAAIYHFTEMNCSGYPVIKPSAGEYHTGYVGNIINPTEFYYQDQTDPNYPKPATEVIISDEITAIHDIDANVDTNYSNAVRYNLSGQRVGRDYRGIVIENGKKVLMK